MIRITDIEGRAVYLHRDSIAAINEAGASSQWHGVRSFVKCFDGRVIEARETAIDVCAQVEADAAIAKGEQRG